MVWGSLAWACLLCFIRAGSVAALVRTPPESLAAEAPHRADGNASASGLGSRQTVSLGADNFAVDEGALSDRFLVAGRLRPWQGLVTRAGRHPGRRPYPVKAAGKHPLHHTRPWLVLPITILVMLTFHKVYHLARTPGRRDVARLVHMVLALAFYLASGSTIILVNKHLIRHLDVRSPIVLANLGSGFLFVITRVLVLCGVVRVDRGMMPWGQYCRIVLPLAACHFLANVLGLWAYHFISVPLIQILNCETIVLVMLVGLALQTESWNAHVLGSVAFIAWGTCIAAVFEETGGGSHVPGLGRPWVGNPKLFGIVLYSLSCLCEAGRAVIIQIYVKNYPVFDALYYATPLYVLLATASAVPVELHTHGLSRLQPSGMLVLFLVLNVVLSSFVVVSHFWVIKLAGAIAMKVAASFRNIVLIFVSVIFTGEVCTVMQYVGYSVSLAGMGFYDRACHMQAARAHKEVGSAGGKSPLA